MHVEVLNACFESVVHIMKTMFSIVPVKQSLGLKKQDQPSCCDISGVIGLVGDLNGLIAITLKNDLAFKLVSEMMGEQVYSISPIVEDAVGELTNIIAGNSKTLLSNRGYDLSISLPSVIIGESHNISTPACVPSFIIGFSTDLSPFWVEVCLRQD